MIGFIQLSHPDSNSQLSRLILKKIEDNSILEVDSSRDKIGSLVWSENGEKLFYAIRGDEESRIIDLNLNTLEKVELALIPQSAELISLLPETDWLVVGTKLRSVDNWIDVYLVNSIDGSVVKVTDQDHARLIQPYLGFENSR